jgi:DNA-binding response OmpR family regulator
MMKILLLEDDQILCDSLKEYLESEGYSVDTAYRGGDVFDLTFDNDYDLYILDVNVPDVNGFDVLRELREADDNTPAMYITALTDINSISKGFSVGADDYVKKPFDPEELIIRIKSKFDKKDERIKYGDIIYDVAQQIVLKDGSLVSLGEVQLKLFHELITNQDRVVDAYTLMDMLEQPNMNALRVNIAKLKSKLGIDIINIRSQGYMIEKI